MFVGKDNSFKQTWGIAFNISFELFCNKLSTITKPVFDMRNKHKANNDYYFVYMPNKHEE